MRQVFQWMVVAVLLCGAAGGATPEEPPDARQREARSVYDEAMKLRTEGHPAEALPRAERALALTEAAYPSPHLEIARCLGLLGELLVRQNQPSARSRSRGRATSPAPMTPSSSTTSHSSTRA